jgi:hypothetical protein
MLCDRFNDGAKDFMIGTKRNVLCKDFRTCPFYTDGWKRGGGVSSRRLCEKERE